MSKPLSISAAIRSYEREPIAFELIRRLRAQTVPLLEIVVIDSGSGPDVIEPLRAMSVPPEEARAMPPPKPGEDAPVVLIEIPNAEYQSGRTLNQALEACRGDLALIISQDALPIGEDYLELMRAPFERDPKIAGAYSRQVLGEHYCPLGEKDLALTYPRREGCQQLPDIRFANTCSMVRREVWRRLPFREEAVISEDQQWAKEAMLSGHKIYYQGMAAVEHFHHRDGARQLWSRFRQEGLGLGRIHGRRLPLAKALFHWAREVASDAVWLTRRGMPQYLGRSLLQRTVKHAALYRGYRQANLQALETPLPASDSPQAPAPAEKAAPAPPAE